jgi:hypothetical protein
MYQRVVLSLLTIIGMTTFNQAVYADITGKVSDQAGVAIKGATLKLVSQDISATTGTDGTYTLATTALKTRSAQQLQNAGITLQNGFLNFNLSEAATVKYEIFNAKGNLLGKEVLKNAQKGKYRLNITEKIHTTTLLVIRASIDGKEMTFNYLPLSNKNSEPSQIRFTTSGNSRVGKLTAVADTIKVTANGFKDQVIAINSYTMEKNITMEAAGTGDCGEFTMKSNKTSTAIPTVGIIEWAYSKNVDSAYIEFGLKGSAKVMKAPVDLKETNYRTLLLGMKQKSNYVFHIIVHSGANKCVSEEYNLTTGTINNAPKITKSGSGTSSMDGGFIITTNGLGTGGGAGSARIAFIFDMDGEVVWASGAPSMPSRARMSWDGKDMWVNNVNVMGGSTSGEMRRIPMDGLNVQNKVSGLSGAHHDFTVTPKNELVTIAHNTSGCSSVLLRASNGTISTLVADMNTLYKPVTECHTNYIKYSPSDDCFLISDRYINAFVKFKRDGTLLWQFGGSNPKGKSFPVEAWDVNHGFDFETDGRFAFFNNGPMMGMGGSGGASKIMEFKLDESKMSATKSWQKNTNGSSSTLGNIQYLPNGHYLVCASNAGQMEEWDNTQKVVKGFSSSEFGYAEYRPSLYGPPNDY